MISLLLLSSLFQLNTPSTFMRESPSQTSPTVSQAYYSENLVFLEKSEEWVKVKTEIDGYTGWIDNSNKVLCELKEIEPNNLIKVCRCAAHVYANEDTSYGPMITLPFESSLKLVGPYSKGQRWLKIELLDKSQGYIQQGDVCFHNKTLTPDEVCILSRQFMGLPYTWGGRCSFGYDCSSFAQMLYRQMGIFLPRDSKDQAQFENFNNVKKFEDLKPTDLIFWGYHENKITHVGFYLGNMEFIHATVAENAPYIHISKLSDDEWNGKGKLPYVTMRTFDWNGKCKDNKLN